MKPKHLIGVVLVAIGCTLLLQWSLLLRSTPITTESGKIPYESSFQWPSSNATQKLPLWLQHYGLWHREQRKQNNWETTHNLLLVRCHENDRCGGTADRLKSLPLMLAMAATSRRVLLIHWSKPYRIEEFFNPGSLFDWSVPEGLLPIWNTTTNRTYHGGTKAKELQEACNDPNIWLVEGNLQYTGGAMYHKLVSKLPQADANPVPDPRELFHDLFHSLFRPAGKLQTLVERHFQALRLTPDFFVVAHYRAKYPGEPYRNFGNVTVLEITAHHAVACAKKLRPSVPVYVASDSLLALQAIQSVPQVVSHLHANLLPHQDPPHLNFATTSNSQEFYSVFLDLFLMSQASCVAFGAGGFGRFGSLVSHNVSCQVAFTKKGKLQNC